MIPDASESTVRITVRVRGNHLEHFYGGELPAIRDGAICDLIVRRSDLPDPGAARSLTASERVQLLSAGTTLMIEVDLHEHHDRALRAEDQGVMNIIGNAVVAVTLVGDLKLTVRAGKRAILRACPVDIPALDCVATSLNHAYSMVSREFEPWRLSSSGNVFRKVHFLASHNDFGEPVWQPLDTLRKQREAAFEQAVFSPSPAPPSNT